ncbi:ribonuclease H-like domain-containing protein [Inediibacterium massiliense]|uniref:ribonuclease H-like domain-containing protein n=1 Tax=Inediibacterium massiliense TaxID=1658111 RepID=UPI0006B59C96|nr:ribonuclease H-like domain-containing protein [Inediibacterium massiliense]
MEILEYKIQESIHLPKNFLLSYEDINFALFDIETTGLSSLHNQVILIGLLYIQNGQITMKQFFCENRKEEIEILQAFEKEIKKFQLFISYNGDTFDIPFLNKRFQFHKITYCIQKHKSLDLLKWVKKTKDLFQFNNCKLKSLEEHLGIYRNDKISGKESVSLYEEYEKNQAEQLKKLILLHNYDDLYYFSKALCILDQAPIDYTLECFPHIFHISDKNIGYIFHPSIKNGYFQLDGFYSDIKIKKDYIIYDNAFHLEYTKKSSSFILKIPLYKGILSTGAKCLYIDTLDFPFSYSVDNTPSVISSNIVIFKEGSIMKFTEIHRFIIDLLRYIFTVHE